MKIVEVNNSKIVFNENDSGCVKDYYYYILEILVDLLKKQQYDITIIYGDNEYNDNNQQKTIRINMNFEHTLVKPGGRDTDDAPIGKIPIQNNSGENYLVRIDKLDFLKKSDIIIDYSIPNIINVKESGLFNDVFDKMVHVSCKLYDFYNIKENRNINVLTTFLYLNQPRRLHLLESAKENGIEIHNINDCFDKSRLCQILQTTKIMVNIHQTEHHDTLEELRIVPALSCGVLVISEESALKEKVPYHKYIIWTSYANIIDTIRDVEENYDKYFEKIFGNNDVEQLLDSLHNANVENMESKIRSVVQN